MTLKNGSRAQSEAEETFLGGSSLPGNPDVTFFFFSSVHTAATKKTAIRLSQVVEQPKERIEGGKGKKARESNRVSGHLAVCGYGTSPKGK